MTSRRKAADRLGADDPRRGRRVRHGRRPGQRAALPAVERDQEGARQGRPRRQRPGPHRDQRGVRRGRHRVHARARRQPRHRATSTAARSRSATRSARPARGSRSTLVYELRRRGGGLGAAALCGGGGQGSALLLQGVPLNAAALDPDGPAPAGFSAGDKRALARVISWVENGDPRAPFGGEGLEAAGRPAPA